MMGEGLAPVVGAEAPPARPRRPRRRAARVGEGPRAPSWPRPSATSRSSAAARLAGLGRGPRHSAGAARPWIRRRLTPPSGKMRKRTWVKGPRRGLRGSRGAGGAAGASCAAGPRASPAARPEQDLEARLPRPAALEGAALGVVALEVVGVDLDLRRSHPGPPRRRISQSWPGPRRRRVSQPSPMLAARPGMMRLSFEPKCMSLAPRTRPPFGIGREVDGPLRPRRAPASQRDLAVDPQPRHPAVGVDVEAHVGEGPIARDREEVLRAALEALGGQDLDPVRPGPEQRSSTTLPGRKQASIEHALREVADEVVGVHVDPADRRPACPAG